MQLIVMINSLIYIPVSGLFESGENAFSFSKYHIVELKRYIFHYSHFTYKSKFFWYIIIVYL